MVKNRRLLIAPWGDTKTVAKGARGRGYPGLLLTSAFTEVRRTRASVAYEG